jgi:predicted metal-dependent enzyme (double-stranded beta helix superfamily)
MSTRSDTRWEPGTGLPPEQLRRFVAEIAREPRRWRHLVRHESDVRVYEQIFSDARVNAWLICWSGGQDTGFHDHDESAGAISVVAGSVRDERLVLGDAPRVREFAAGEQFEVPPTAIHRVIHSGAENAITIHAYSPPLLRMGAYRVAPDGQLERQALTCEQELCAERGLELLAGAAGADGAGRTGLDGTAGSSSARAGALSSRSRGVSSGRARGASPGAVGVVPYRGIAGASLAVVAGGPSVGRPGR